MAELIVEPIQTAELESSGYAGQPEGNIDLTENNVQVNVAPYKYATPKIPIQDDKAPINPQRVEQTIYPDEGYAGMGHVTVNPPNLETKTVTPKATAFDVEASEEYVGLGKVIVNATPLESKTITPTTQQQTVYPQSPAIGFDLVTVEAFVPEFADINAPLVLVDWEGTPLKSYSHSEAMALTSIPNPSDLSLYPTVDHEYLLFQEWTHTLQEVKDYLQYRPYGNLRIGAIYTTTDGQIHRTYNNERVQSEAFIQTYKSANISNAGGFWRNCNALKAISIQGSSFANFKQYEFGGCLNLNHFNVPRNILTIRYNDNFSGSGLKSIILPPTTNINAEQSFSSCTKLKYIVIPNATTVIGPTLFYGCSSLLKIEVHKNITAIRESAFSNCTSLIDIIIYSKPTAGNANVFANINSNYKIYVPRDNLSFFQTETNWASMYSATHFVTIEDNIDYLERIGCDVHEYKEAES